MPNTIARTTGLQVFNHEPFQFQVSHKVPFKFQALNKEPFDFKYLINNHFH